MNTTATTSISASHYLGWAGIVRLGLVQTALGAIVVLTTSTLNRVMVVELGLLAMLPGALVGLHYAIQLARPKLGHASDVGGKRSPWIIGGVAVLAIGGILAALATAWMSTQLVPGLMLAVLAFILIGLGVGAAGTSLLALLAKTVAPQRRAAAGSIVWVMMIAGFILTAGIGGHFLEPFTLQRLIVVTSTVCALAFVLTLIAIAGIEKDRTAAASASMEASKLPFRQALAETWSDPRARQFTIFVFVSMLAYSAQDLILEPFAGLVFGYSPRESTQMAGLQNAGVLLGMIVVALGGTFLRGRMGSLRIWTTGGCIASALALFGLLLGGQIANNGGDWPLQANVFALGLGNGVFAVAAIASMMALAGEGGEHREGVRMGLWGAAQAAAFGIGGFIGALGVDVFNHFYQSPAYSYGAVFLLEGLVFLLAAWLAWRIRQQSQLPQSDRLHEAIAAS